MQDDDFKNLQKEVRKAKRIAAEKAGILHDLVEDRLPMAYEEIPLVASECYKACKEWAAKNAVLQALQPSVQSLKPD